MAPVLLYHLRAAWQHLWVTTGSVAAGTMRSCLGSCGTKNAVALAHKCSINRLDRFITAAAAQQASYTTAVQQPLRVLDSSSGPELLQHLDTLMFDQDGVLWRGHDLIPNAVEVGGTHALDGAGLGASLVGCCQFLFVSTGIKPPATVHANCMHVA